MTCVTVMLYKTEFDCHVADSCGSNAVQDCTATISVDSGSRMNQFARLLRRPTGGVRSCDPTANRSSFADS